jgi:hypothetical protein
VRRNAAMRNEPESLNKSARARKKLWHCHFSEK